MQSEVARGMTYRGYIVYTPKDSRVKEQGWAITPQDNFVDVFARLNAPDYLEYILAHNNIISSGILHVHTGTSDGELKDAVKALGLSLQSD